MSKLQPDQYVVAEGTFLYDGLVECDIRIFFSPICYGCGDFDEVAHIEEDLVRDTYYVDFGSTTERGVFKASGGGYPSLEEAMAQTRARPGFGSTVKWTKFYAQRSNPADA